MKIDQMQRIMSEMIEERKSLGSKVKDLESSARKKESSLGNIFHCYAGNGSSPHTSPNRHEKQKKVKF